MGRHMEKYQLNEKNRRIFLEGLQRYQDRGVIIRIDGKKAEASDWIKIFEEQPDGSFYMGDYVMEEDLGMEEEIPDKSIETIKMVCEDSLVYETTHIEAETGKGVDGCSPKEISGRKNVRTRILKEIRFDRVYHW